jgi:hypothetical protein
MIFVDTLNPLPSFFVNDQGTMNSLKVTILTVDEFLNGRYFGPTNNNDGRSLKDKTLNYGIIVNKLSVDFKNIDASQNP